MAPWTRHANDPPTWLERFRSGKPEVADELMKEAAAAKRRALWVRVRGWFGR